MWNERYSKAGYLFGKDPALFLKEHDDYLKPGARALAIADGEGRNSVYMASKGVQVTAMDGSNVAVDKARALADANDVSIDFNVADIMTWDWERMPYDLVVGVFIQFVGPKQRAQIFEGMKKSVKPGGIVMLHGYTPKQLEYGTGGPGRLENLYTTEILEQAFGDFEILTLKAYDRDIDEGAGHSGLSALIDLIARRPE